MADENNITKFLSAIMASVQDVEDALQQLLTERAVDTAVGVQLDALGRIVGQERGAMSDDDYRRHVRARIAANNSEGLIRDILDVATLVIYDDDATFEIDVQGVATYVLRVNDVATTDAIGNILHAFLVDATAAGVRPVLEYNTAEPGDWFTFDDGPGWDVGVLSTAV